VNEGQLAEPVRFLSRGRGYALFLTPDEVVFSLARGQGRKFVGIRGLQKWLACAHRTRTSSVLRMKLIGATPTPQVEGLDPLPSQSNYFIGSNPANWRTSIANYARVRYRNVYPGVDLTYYGKQGQLEYDFLVAPGADPKSITLRFQGASRLEVDS